jgi:hypothetical protein
MRGLYRSKTCRLLRGYGGENLGTRLTREGGGGKFTPRMFTHSRCSRLKQLLKRIFFVRKMAIAEKSYLIIRDRSSRPKTKQARHFVQISDVAHVLAI